MTYSALRQVAAAAGFTLASALAFSAPSPGDHVGLDAERGDPARWYVPADTPKLRYETQLKEARAALAEALRECRAQREGRPACEAQARGQHRSDVEDARQRLLRDERR